MQQRKVRYPTAWSSLCAHTEPPETPLTEQEQQFVIRCKLEVNKRAIAQDEKTYAGFIDSFCDSLENALADERQKPKDKADI